MLSPARDLIVGKAAIDAGADAVYIGAPLFSARQAAGNSIADIKELCRYAHIFSCRVLVALNTLLTDEERREAVSIAWQLYKAGADALIIQDLNLLGEDLPPIRLHASTQCDNRTAEDVIMRRQQGFRRAVLARELTIEEIRRIRERLGERGDMELEAFIHGALCVSYSGRCYLSEHVLGTKHSANRGSCAQLCRWQYDLLDKDKNLLTGGQYPLSLRDLDRSRSVREMLDAGITTLKIEGRLKDAAYVRNITAYYRLLLDRLFAEPDSHYCRASKGSIYLDFTPNPEKTFHRSQTDYFLHGRTPDLANWQTPKSTGEYIGEVTSVGKNCIEIQTDIALHNGDGLCFGDKGFLVNRVEGNRVYPNQMPQIKAGTQLYRNYDIEFMRQVEHSKTSRRLPVDILFQDTDCGFMLRIGDTEQEFAAEKTPADNPQKALQNIRNCLTKLGDTPFEAASITVNLSQPCFIPASMLNSWRRQVVESAMSKDLRQLRDERIKSKDRCADRVKTDDSLNPCSESVSPDSSNLMTCRYCILFETGLCRKTRKQTDIREPAYLRNGNTLLRLNFDCANCRMTITDAVT